MTFTLFSENKLWGIKTSQSLIKDQPLLSPIYDELSIFIIKNGCLQNIIQSRKKNTALEKIREKRNNQNPDKNSLNLSSEEINIETDSQIIFLVKRGDEFLLLKNSRTVSHKQIQILNVFTHFNTLVSFHSDYHKIENLKKDNKYYESIIHIGQGLFKVKIIVVYLEEYEINEDGKTAKRLILDNFYWIIINFNGDQVSDLKFQDVEQFNNNYCKVKRGNRWNYINNKGEIILNVWCEHLEYPNFNGDTFLAAPCKSYLISNYSDKRGYLIKTANLGNSNKSFYELSNDELLNKSIKSNFSDSELEIALNRLLGNEFDRIGVQEYTNLDLYDSTGLIKEVGIKSCKEITETLFCADIESFFFIEYLPNLEMHKIFRHIKESSGYASELWSYYLAQKRLLDNNGEFVGDNYYHTISEFNKNGFAKVSKSFFSIKNNLETIFIDTSINEETFKGDIDFWDKNYDPLYLKYGYIDSTGKEVIECKYEEDELRMFDL